MTSRWSSSSRARTSGTALTGDTAALTSSLRIAAADVDAVDHDRGAERVGAGQDLGLVAAGGDRRRRRGRRRPGASSHQVIARNIAPVSR